MSEFCIVGSVGKFAPCYKHYLPHIPSYEEGYGPPEREVREVEEIHLKYAPRGYGKILDRIEQLEFGQVHLLKKDKGSKQRKDKQYTYD